MGDFFNSSLGVKFSPNQIINEILRFMKADTKRRYRITIGTDSEKTGGHNADFVTAIVIHRIGNGGRYFWRRIYLDEIHSLRDRMWREVVISIDIAKAFLKQVDEFKEKIPEFDFEIHVDVGEKGDTKNMIQELIGMIRAYNFEARTKPGSYAASNVADRHVKGN